MSAARNKRQRDEDDDEEDELAKSPRGYLAAKCARMMEEMDSLRKENSTLKQLLAPVGVEQIVAAIEASEMESMENSPKTKMTSTTTRAVRPNTAFTVPQLGIAISNFDEKIARSIEIAVRLYKNEQLKRAEKHAILQVFSSFSNEELKMLFACGSDTMALIRKKVLARTQHPTTP